MDPIDIFNRRGKIVGEELAVVSVHGVPMDIPRPEDAVIHKGVEYIVEDVQWDLDAKKILILCQFVNEPESNKLETFTN